MWFSAVKLAVNAGSYIYKKRQETKMLMSDAARLHAERMAKGDIEYKGQILSAQDKGWKDEFVLILVASPVMLLIWSIFSDDPDIRQKIDIFFEYFGNMPFWYQALFIGVVSAIYGLKGADIIKKK